MLKTKTNFISNNFIRKGVEPEGFHLISKESLEYNVDDLSFKYRVVIDVYKRGYGINVLVIPCPEYLTDARMEEVIDSTGIDNPEFHSDFMYSAADVQLFSLELVPKSQKQNQVTPGIKPIEVDIDSETDIINDSSVIYNVIADLFNGYESIEDFVHQNLKDGERFHIYDWDEYVSGFKAKN